MPSSSPKYFTSHTLHRSPRRSTLFIVSCCLVIGVSGFLFGLVALFATSGRCRAVEPRSVRVAWDQSSGGVNGEWVRRKVVGFVGIQTGFGSVGRRRSLRKTWMPSDSQGLQRLEEATGLAFRFIIGKTADRTKMSELRKEIAEYDDFILLDIEEEYRKLPYKTLAFFKAAYALYDADFYVKADDDIYLRPDRLSLLLAKERSHHQTYLGCMKKGPVFTDPKQKWFHFLRIHFTCIFGCGFYACYGRTLLSFS